MVEDTSIFQNYTSNQFCKMALDTLRIDSKLNPRRNF